MAQCMMGTVLPDPFCVLRNFRMCIFLILMTVRLAMFTDVKGQSSFCTVSTLYNVNSPVSFPLSNATFKEQTQTATQLNPSFTSISDYIVRKHNCLRSVVQPSATNMLKMVWNKDAAAQAQKWATNCVYAHNSQTDRTTSQFGCGQNIAMSTGGAISWNQVINMWFNEVNSYVYGGSNSGTVDTGHYTQIAWATTFQVGCGWKSCGGSRPFNFYVCNYCPGGNMAQPTGVLGVPYIRGNFCATCGGAACQAGRLCTNSCPYQNVYSNCNDLDKGYQICTVGTLNSALGASCKATCLCKGRIF